VITRDRVSYTRHCLASLEQYSHLLDIHIVDHGSTWELMQPLLDGGKYPVTRRGDETPRSLWEWPGLWDIVGDKPYLVTDPDVVLDLHCPEDWLKKMMEQLVLPSGRPTVKVGLGIMLDDLPATTLGAKAREWEYQFWTDRRNADSWYASVDTTLALYPPLEIQPTFSITPAVRLDAPYLIKHLPWYGDLDPGEAAYYRAHALPGASHWVNGGW
jgi:hypothetical protein